MAKTSVKELGRKAEELIEKGNDADQNIQSCQSRVSAASNRVNAAIRQLNEASETDEEGNPKGDVQGAMAQLNMAQNQLAASKRALASARSEAQKVVREKNAHVQEISHYKSVENSNLAKLRQLRSNAFAANSEALTEGIVDRINEAEDARVELLRSMGVDASPDRVSAGSEGGATADWKGGGFGSLDTGGQAESYRGGGSSEGLPTGGGVSAPAGGGLNGIGGVGTGTSGAVSLIGAGEIQAVGNGQEATGEKSLRISDEQRYRMGLSFIDDVLNNYRKNLLDRGIDDGEAMEVALAEIKGGYLQILSEDIKNGTSSIYDITNPDFDALAEKIRADYVNHPPKYVINNQQREKIRQGIRKGIVTEKDIRDIGQNVREKYDQLILAKHREYDEIQNEHFNIANELENATTREEKERIEYRRQLLVQRENAYSEKYDSMAMMRSVLSQYRELGPMSKDDKQPYERSVFSYGSGKVIKAIDNVREYIPTDWVKRSDQKPISPKHVPRGYFLPGTTSDIVALSGGESHMQSCAFHEMGHRFENMYPEILTIEKQFYDRRTAGEELSWLGRGYDKKEVTRFDNFISPYMGKDYGGSGYELLSMGMEGAYCETVNLSRDPEYENLILGILAAI